MTVVWGFFLFVFCRIMNFWPERELGVMLLCCLAGWVWEVICGNVLQGVFSRRVMHAILNAKICQNIQKQANYSIYLLQVCVILIFTRVFFFPDLLSHRKKLHLWLHRSGWSSWCSCTCPGCLQLPALESCVWATGHLINPPTHKTH